MAHSQSSPRGLFAKNRIDVGANQLTGNSTALLLNQGVQLSGKSTAVVTGDTTGIVLTGGVKVSNARLITANTTAFVLDATSALPGNVDAGAAFTLVSNSTGVSLAVNTTGTTWSYVQFTSVQET